MNKRMHPTNSQQALAQKRRSNSYRRGPAGRPLDVRAALAPTVPTRLFTHPSACLPGHIRLNVKRNRTHTHLYTFVF